MHLCQRIEPTSIGAIGERVPVETLVEGVTRNTQHGAQPAARIDHAAASILTKAFDDGLIAFQLPYQPAEPDIFERLCERHAAASASDRTKYAEPRQFLHDLVQMVAR